MRNSICWTPNAAPSWKNSPAQRTVSATVDRKSTRLNSSHSQISYAVFCLKKKKTDQVGQYEVTHRFVPGPFNPAELHGTFFFSADYTSNLGTGRFCGLPVSRRVCSATAGH